MHLTVMKREAVEALNIHPSDVIVDATLGSGGHGEAILKKLDEHGTLIALDVDSSATEAAEKLLRGTATVRIVNRNFRELGDVLQELGIPEVDGILADLGWRMEQFSGSGKGFSFKVDEELLMTYGNPGEYTCTARDIVNDWDERDIANVLKGYGEERFSRRIAERIVRTRQETPIETSGQLADIVSAAVPAFRRRGKTHPATQTFQALRIAANDELGALTDFLETAVTHLASGGRLAIITFHSIEDRIVKQTFRSLQDKEKGTVITKKPMTSTDEEIRDNPRARSAKLRIFEKS